MSASSKKKLRKENAAAALTERQKQEQAEAKKLKRITVTFVAVMLVVALTAATILSIRAVNNSGVIDRNTIAAVTGTHELNSVQINYYFTDSVRNMYSQWQSSYGENVATYMALMGLDISKPLDEQFANIEKTETWADRFLKQAIESAKSEYALYDKAMADPNFKLSDDQQSVLDYNLKMIDLYASISGYKNANKYLQAIYGYGADMKSYTEYCTVSSIASAYYSNYANALEYTDAEIRKHEEDKFNDYSSFTYAIYQVTQSDYLKSETASKDEKNPTYTDAEKEAALAKAKEIADNLAKSANLADLDKAISELEINKDKKDKVTTTKYTDTMYASVLKAVQEWISSEDRQSGDITVIANETTTKDKDGKETKTTSGYYVVHFSSRDDNLRHLANVRHLLVEFEGGKTDANGNKTYTTEEKAAAKAEAERLLKVWKDGNATEQTFIDLVKEHSDDTSAEDGGLFEDIHRESGYVPNFKNWAIDPERKVGDTGVIESEYGYHVMYYSSDDELTYRDYMISEDLRNADVTKWYDGINNAATITLDKTNRINTDLIIAAII